MIGSNTTKINIIHQRITPKKKKYYYFKTAGTTEKTTEKNNFEYNLEKLQRQQRIDNEEMFSNHQQKAWIFI